VKTLVRDGLHTLLSAEELARLGRVSVGSRFTVEGTMNGSHRSRRKGLSVEFSDYRHYVAGDDIKHLDWKVYARNERLYLRQYEEETTLRVHLMVDSSSSMGYSGKEGISKYWYACQCAAAFAYITVKQSDTPGLAIFDEKPRVVFPPLGGAEHLRTLCNSLVSHKVSDKTDMGTCLHQLAEQATRRGLVVIFSDLFDDTEVLRASLAHFRRRHHDVIVFQVLDRTELDFPFRAYGTFQDPETNETLTTSPKDICAAYQQVIAEHIQTCKGICSSLDCQYVMAVTDVPPVELLVRSLRSR